MNKILTLFLVGASFLLPAFASAQVPAYGVEYMGPGYGTMNNTGVVIGNESAVYPGNPWVNVGSGLQYLPLPANAVAGSVADINDAGVIVGAIDTDGDSINDVPVKWTPDGQGAYVVETLPLAGALRGHAVAINNYGVILATGLAIGTLPTYTAYVINGVNVTHVGLSNPMDINDNGIILTNNQLYDYTNATPIAFDPLPADMPQGYLYPAAINNNNEVIVNILTTIISYTRYHAIGIYTVGVGWDLLMDVQTIYTAGSINDNGDVTLNHVNSGCGLVYLSGLGYYCPASLLADGSLDWAVSGASVIAYDPATNDRTILARGGNSITSQYGLVRLSEVGDLPVPDAPINLVATPHEPTWQQPFNTIDLSWDPAGTLTRSYILKRKGPADTDFVELARLTNDFYRDGDIVGGETYAYRVLAVGLAGNSAPSEIAFAVAPMPADNVDPVITSVSLQDGEVVSGKVSISVTATDDVAIWYINMSAAGLSCTVYSAEAVCNWDTSSLAVGNYQVMITAVDTMGNYAQETVTVTVEEATTGGGKDKPNKGNGGSGNGKGRGNK
jgi:hypothetical protein